MFDQIIGWIKKLTEAGISLLALGIVMQVIFGKAVPFIGGDIIGCLLYTSPSPRDRQKSRMPSSA